MEAKYIKFKNIFIICILLIFLVSLSTAVASDLGDTNKIKNEGNLTVQSSTVEPAVDESNQEITNDGQSSESNQLLASSNDEDVLGEGTLSDLNDAISGSSASLGDDYAIGSQVTISSNKVIDGQNHYIRASGSNNRIFQISSNTEVTLKNIKFMNGKLQGGAIYIYSNAKVNIINCTFESNNPSSSYNGGAIYVSGGSVNLTDCTFKSNGYSSSGGVIYLTSSAKANITNCTFDSNRANFGGAIYLISGVYANITNCTFKSNTASSNGGAIYSSTKNLKISDCTFKSNSASSNGGAIYSTNDLTVADSTFELNNATYSGGAIDSLGYTLNISNSNFKSNKITSQGNSNGNTGGAGVHSTSINVTISKSTFELNSIPDNVRGASIYILPADGTAKIYIVDSNFTKNTAVGKGPGICLDSKTTASQLYYSAEIRGCVFKDNVMSGSVASQGGGAIHIYRDAIVKIYSSLFINNSANLSEGGAIRFSSDLSVYDCQFYSNKAKQGGALCYGQTITLNVQNSIFKDNYAQDGGGAIKARTSTMDTVTFINNYADNEGGAILARSGGLDVVNGQFINNSAKVRGGAIFVHDNVSDVNVKVGSTFNNNSAERGGAIYSNTASRVSISTATFTSNTAKEGGAGYFTKGQMSISLSDFFNNNATVSGGAVYVLGDGGEIANSNFYYNTATSLGGAIHWAGTNGVVSSSKFVDNVAINGSSIYWSGANGDLRDSEFYDTNVVSGSVYWHANSGKISRSKFSGLNAVYICDHSSVTLSSNTQTSNSQTGYAVYNGGIAQFDSNNFQNLIYNYGVISSPTYLVSLNNMTIVTDQNSRIIFTSVEDDNGNYIYVTDNIEIVYDGNETFSTTFNNTHYIAYLSNMPIGLHTFAGIGYNASTLTNLRLKNGAILYLVMNLTVNQTNYGEKVVFTTKIVNTTLNGTIILKVNDVSYSVPLINGTAEHILYNMAPNTYVVVSSYLDYNQTLTANIDIDVQSRNSTVNITANNITYGGIVTINVTVTNGTTGNVYIFVNNKMYTVKLVNSTCQLNLTDLPGNIYHAYAVYNGDVNFNGNVSNTMFNVAKHNLTINITAEDIEMGQTAIIDVKLPSDANGTTYVYVDTTPYIFTKQPIRIAVANLTSGNHTVRVIYDGNEKYLSNSNSTIFEVHKIIVRPTIIANNIKVGDNATITVNLNGATNATGRVFLNINGRGYYTYVNNTKATIVIPGLAYGTYNVTATYEGDDKYYSNSTNGTFRVDYAEINPIITYSADDNLDVIVNVTVPKDVNGDIIIEVDGKNYTSNIVKGLFTVPIKGLTGGVYPSKMYFANDTKYRAVNKAFNITLKKIDTTIYINATYIYVGDNETITVFVPADAKGNVTIRVYNDNYTTSNYTMNVTNGTSVFTVSGLAFGSYTVHAVYSGDRKYNTVAHDTGFNVRKVDLNPYSYITAKDIFVGETATINITMPSDLNDEVYLTIQNKTYTVNITNGTGQINISGLKYGFVHVLAEFKGNEKYLPGTRDYDLFSVHRISNYPMNITAQTSESSVNITVNIPNDANGTGYFTISNETFNKTYTIKYTNGKSNMTTVTGLLPGKPYVVYAYFEGNDKYAPGDTVRTLNSDKTLNYTFEVTSNNILVGEVAYVTIYLPNITNGTVTIRVPGRVAVSIKVNETFVNGTYKYPIYDLKAGSHLGSVTYDGNDIYEASSRYGTIFVSKRMVDVSVEYNTTYVGQNLTLKVNLPSDSNGTVNITINNNVYNATVINGTAYVTVPNLEAKRYDAFIFYSGNEKYVNDTKPFYVNILKISNYAFDLGVVDIKVGDNETITIHLPSDIDVNVTISIPGTVHINKTVEIIKGNGTIIISNLTAGVYTVTANVVNSSKYMDQTVTKSFTVSTRDDYLFNLHNLTTVYVRDNITFILDLPKDAIGNVTVFIFNNNYTAEVKNGTATINVTAQRDGTHEFTISFEQKGKYNYKSLDALAVVVKKAAELNPNYKATVYVDENVTFEFKLPNDATGNITVTSRGVSYTGKLVNGSVNITIKGYTVESLYSPFISYTGDDKYFQNSTTVTVNVTKVKDYDLNVTVANITVEQDEIVNITLPKDVTEDVLISGNFTDQTYSVKLVNGTAQFVISNLAAGNYSINVRYQGYQKYEDKNVTLTFNVRKLIPPIAIEFVNNEVVVVTLPQNANGNATLVIKNNESVKINARIEIVNGRGVLNVSSLRPGNYSVNATFLGGARYLQNSTSRNITLPKIKDYILPISVEDIIVGENAKIIIVVPENATGCVNITVDGGEVIKVPITGNVVIYNATGLKVGDHTVQANYSNVEYEFATNSTKFTVNKNKVTINNVISDNVTSITLNISLTKTVSGGNLTISIDNVNVKNFTNINSHEFNFTVPILPGDHVITIKYSGDENHSEGSRIDVIQIPKIKDYTLIVDATSLITVIENNIVTVTLPKGIEGNVEISINNDIDYTASINSTTGKATFKLDTLPSGNYTIKATFSNDIYDYQENTTNFTVIKLNTTIDVQVENITKDMSEVINITLNNTATGYVYIEINGTVFRVDVDGNGTATLKRSNIPQGNYTAVITYVGDDYFNSNSTTVYFTVSKIPVNITITAHDVYVGQEVNFTIETSKPITDQVTVRIDNKNYTAVLYNGKGNLIVLGQNVGVHNVTVIYAGDDDYLPANVTINVTVYGKLPTSVTVNVTNITVGESVTIYINLTGDVNGTVAIAMLGNPIIVQMVNGTGNYTYYNLTARDYHFTVAYFESEFYLASNATGDFTVFKKNSPISANVTNATVGDVEVITVNLPTNATGTVLLTVNGSNYYGKVDKGVARFNVTGLPVGNHTAYITYEGDNNYLENETEINLTTARRTTTINITTANVIVDGHPVTFTIMTSANLTEVVTITIGNNNYTTFVKEGKGTYTVHGLATGNYTATVYFAGNTYYGNATNFTEFNVTCKAPVSITVDVKNITLGEVARIHVKVNVTTGQVRLNMAGNPQTLDVNATGEVIFEVPNLLARDYHVTVTYIENDDYLSNSATANFTVFRKPTNITVNVSDIFVGDNETVKINVTANASGVVLINIAGVHVYAELDENSTAEIIFEDLGVGEYNVTATYMGDTNYLSSTANATFKVTKLTTGIVIEGSNITVGQTETFNITTSANITEVVYIEINGTNYTSFVREGKGTFTVPYTLKEGTYTVYVYFPGNSKYDFVMNHTVIKVSAKKASNITINVESITVGDDVTIYVNVTDGATGTVAISVAGESYLVQLNNSKANITLSNLTARHYHVSAYYLGDDYYLECNNTNEFDVLKKQSSINVTATNVTVGNDAVIDISITNGTSGVVLIDINGTDYWATINNGVAQLIVKNLAVGNYTVTVRYEGDTNYNASSNATKFKVSKLNSFINVGLITVSPIAYGNDVLVNVTAPDDVTGVAILNVTGDSGSNYYTVYVNNGEGSFIITKPDVGHYTVSAVYEENYRYLSNTSNTVAFEVYANGTELDVITHNIYVGETENITVIIAGDYSGDVNITIDGTILRNASLEYNATSNSSVAVLHFSDKLAAGIHTVEATYTAVEGGKIVAHKGSAIFIVSKNNSTVGINHIDDIKVGENATIVLTLLPDGATGTIDVYVNGEKRTVNVTDLTLIVPNLAFGHYEVQAMYSGDDKYLSSSANASFTVYKNDIALELEVANITVDQSEYLNVTLRNATGDVAVDAFGYVLVNINGTQYYAEIKEGVARIAVKDLAIGKYDVNATFIGDDKYYSNSTTGNFTVSKLKTNIEINATDIFVDQNEVFKFTTSENITSVVIIKVNDVNYTAFVENGKGNFTLSGLTAGPYNVTIYFNGNDKYDAISNVINFTVKSKRVSSINVTVADITVGDNITVYVNATAGINGPAYVTIAGVAYPCELVDGRANFTVAGLSARDYVVSVFFMGNDEYALCNSTSNFTVHKKEVSFTVTVTNATVGNVEYINVTFNETTAKGNVLLTINGAHYYATIESGVARFNVTGLKEGVWDVTVNYEGDGVFNATVGTAKVNTTKLTTTISIVAINITVGQDEVFNITASANITEVVTIEIVGVANYTAYVINGTGTFTVPVKLAADDYDVNVYFPGNTQYGPAQGSANFTVTAKKASAITVNVTDITVGENATIRVNVTKGASGNVTIVIAGNEYEKALDAGGVAIFNIEGLSARDYHVTAIYNGDTYYEVSRGEDNFTVNKKDAPIGIVVTNSTVGGVEYINVTVPYDGTEYVLLTIGNAHYYADVVGGVARFNITGLLVGNYTANATYVGDTNYTSNFTSADFTVSKINTTISIAGHPIIVGQEEVLTFEIDQNITALVHIEIDGVNKTAYLVEGKGTLALTNLTAKEYTVTIYYDGDDVYMPSNNSATFTVEAKKPSAVTINVTGITVGDVAKIIVNVTKGATGNVTLVIAGNETSLKVNDDGIVEFNIPDLTARDYHITAIYEGDTYYDGSRNTAEFTVHRIPTSVELNVSDIVVGDTEIINVTVTNATTGVVLINISGTCYYSDLKDGKATFNIPGLKTGNYEAVVRYVENEKYANSSAAKSFKVQPLVTLEVGENNGNTTPITVKVSDNATGKVNVTIGNKTYEADVVNGTATVNVTNATPGKQDVTVTFDDGTGNPTVQNKTVDIPKVTGHTVTANATVVDKGNGTVEVVVTGPADAEGNVTVTIGNQTVTVPMENGTAKVNVTGVPVGSHDVDVSYSGDDKYGAVSNRTHVNVPINLPTVNVVDHLVRGWNSQFDYEAVFTNEFGEVLVNTTVTFVVNGKPYTVKTETHGIARLSETLPVGEYTITSINPVTGENVTKKLSIVPRLIYNKDLTMDFVDGSHWDVLVIGDDGNPVGEGEIIDIYVNTIHYVAKTDKNGYARLKINLNPNKYHITAEYKNFKVQNNLVVKQTLKLVKKTVKVKKGKKLVLKAKLKWSNGKAIKGKKIVFKFKGKKYKAKTNSKGIAKVTVKKKVTKKLKKGKKYSYSATYITNTVKGKVKVKK